MKCWEDRGLYDGPKNFDPLEFLAKIKVDNYRWDRLKLQVSQHAWIEPAVLVKEVDKLAFVVALEAKDGRPALPCRPGDIRLDVEEGRGPVDLGLALAQEVQVGSVDEEDGEGGRHRGIVRGRQSKRMDARIASGGSDS